VSEDWSPPRIVEPHAPEPVVLGEMAAVRQSWRAQRRERMGRRIWPAVVVLLLAVIITSVVLLGVLMRF
jgi:hypothetical protein